jgi:hypothetical protein
MVDISLVEESSVKVRLRRCSGDAWFSMFQSMSAAQWCKGSQSIWTMSSISR